MNQETAKQTIQAYLDLGTLQGVKVEYEYGEEIVFEKSFNREVNRVSLREDNVRIRRDDVYADIKSIEPIPLQPKLLEVGDRVRVIGGEYEGKVGEIVDTVQSAYEVVWDKQTKKYNDYVDFIYVVPESLLVEEEEQAVPDDRYISLPTEDMIKALNQAGYKVTKE